MAYSGKKNLFKTIFEPKHLLACVKLELPFLVFDEATLKLINLNSEAIEGIYIKPEYNRLVIMVLVRYYEENRTPHEIALERLGYGENGVPDIEFLI